MFHNTPEAESHFQQFTQGNERAFNHIYGYLHKHIYRHARNLLHDSFELDSIVQDAFLLAWDHRKRMKSVLHIMRFVRQCVRWRCCDYFKRASKRSVIFPPIDPHKEIYVAVCHPEEEMEPRNAEMVENEQLELIVEALLCLPLDRKLITALYKRGVSIKRIAKRVRFSSKRVKSELEKAFLEIKHRIVNMKRAAKASRNIPTISVSDFEIYLRPEEAYILRRFYEDKYTLNQIAQELNSTVLRIQKQYFLAIKKISSAKIKKIKTCKHD